MTNEAKMTLEEKLVQRIKSDTLMSAIGDEDMLTELVKRALREALFQERTVGTGYHSRKEPSLAVSEAQKIAAEAITRLAQEMFEEVVARPDVRKAINDAMPWMVLEAMKQASAYGVVKVMNESRDAAEIAIRNAVANSLA